MIKICLVANKESALESELVMPERSWRPARSLMAIANQKHSERKGWPVVTFEELQDLDENLGHGLDEAACLLLANEMEALVDSPFELVDYGMTVDIEDGDMVYTYPTDMTTAYYEEIETGKFFSSLEDDDILGKRVRSWFRTTKAELQEVITFLKVCGGFAMP
jgi:hypothetical protein